MFTLKHISQDAIPRALEKAERYRLLNEPWEAESICLDVLESEPDNQRALVCLVLSLTDQFVGHDGTAHAERRAKEALTRVRDPYQRTYYAAIIIERRAKAQVRQHILPGHIAFESFREAMALFEEAEALAPPDNQDSKLRWNACARIVMSHPHVRPAPEHWASDDIE